MSGHDRERAEAKRWSKKQKADCRADTRGGSWAGIPKCLIDSPAYRDLSLHARAVLVELVAKMNGYNNGEIVASNRQLVEALGCSPNRIVTAIAELMAHGFLDVTVEGQWKARQARLYRLTFISTKSAAATNEYLGWTPSPKKSGATGAIAGGIQSATGAIAETPKPATAPIARLLEHKRARANPSPPEPATGAIALICKPCPPAPEGERKGDDGLSTDTPTPAGHRCGDETEAWSSCARCGAGFAQVGTQVTRRYCSEPCRSADRGQAVERCCDQCGGAFKLERADRAYPRRFCSETCRKRAERARAYERRKHESEPTPIGSILNGTVARLVAGARA